VLRGLVALTRKHALDELESACETALSYRCYTLRTLRKLIGRQAEQQKPLEILAEHPLIRPLDAYGQVVAWAIHRRQSRPSMGEGFRSHGKGIPAGTKCHRPVDVNPRADAGEGECLWSGYRSPGCSSAEPVDAHPEGLEPLLDADPEPLLLVDDHEAKVGEVDIGTGLWQGYLEEKNGAIHRARSDSRMSSPSQPPKPDEPKHSHHTCSECEGLRHSRDTNGLVDHTLVRPVVQGDRAGSLVKRESHPSVVEVHWTAKSETDETGAGGRKVAFIARDGGVVVEIDVVIGGTTGREHIQRRGERADGGARCEVPGDERTGEFDE